MSPGEFLTERMKVGFALPREERNAGRAARLACTLPALLSPERSHTWLVIRLGVFVSTRDPFSSQVGKP